MFQCPDPVLEPEHRVIAVRLFLVLCFVLIWYVWLVKRHTGHPAFPVEILWRILADAPLIHLLKLQYEMMFYCDSVFVTGGHCTLEWCCVTFHLKPWYGITAPVTDELLLKWGWLAAMGHEDTYAHCSLY